MLRSVVGAVLPFCARNGDIAREVREKCRFISIVLLPQAWSLKSTYGGGIFVFLFIFLQENADGFYKAGARSGCIQPPSDGDATGLSRFAPAVGRRLSRVLKTLRKPCEARRIVTDPARPWI